MSPYFLLVYALFLIYVFVILISIKKLRTLDKYTWTVIILVILVVGPVSFLLIEK